MFFSIQWYTGQVHVQILPCINIDTILEAVLCNVILISKLSSRALLKTSSKYSKPEIGNINNEKSHSL